jgi:hypothetical protein
MDIIVAATMLDRAKLMQVLSQSQHIVQTELGSFCFRHRGKYRNIDVVADERVGVIGFPGEVHEQHVCLARIASPWLLLESKIAAWGDKDRGTRKKAQDVRDIIWLLEAIANSGVPVPTEVFNWLKKDTAERFVALNPRASSGFLFLGLM